VETCKHVDVVVPPQPVKPGHNVLFNEGENQLYPVPSILGILSYNYYNPDNKCGALVCSLKKPGCNIAYDGTNFKIDQQGKF
jgi:hypothetical protein